MILAKYEGAEVYASDPCQGAERRACVSARKKSSTRRARICSTKFVTAPAAVVRTPSLLAVPNPSLVPEALALARPGDALFTVCS